jgi:glutathione-specific gamma-glutamylcyclotransferase
MVRKAGQKTVQARKPESRAPAKRKPAKRQAAKRKTAKRKKKFCGPGRKARDIWVFGYGSLMWDPKFPYLEVQPARLRGYHRSLCIYSRVHRGTLERPGVVVGLDRGGSCQGYAFRVEGIAAPAILGYLDERELVGYAYRRVCMRTDIPGRSVKAWTYVADHKHSQYAGKLSLQECAGLVLQGVGMSGTALEYLESMIAQLTGHGIVDKPLERILARVRAAAS